MTQHSGGSLERNPSLWMLTDPPQDRYEPLSADARAEVVVVGAGIAGLMTAYVLEQRGADVLVLERDRVGTGVTGFTTGKVTSLHGLVYATLRDRYSPEVAAIYADANETGLTLIRNAIADSRIECDLRELPAFTFTQDAENVSSIEDEVEAAKAAGLAASLVNETDLPFAIEAAIRVDNQLHIHPRMFLDGIASKLKRVREHTEVTDVDASDDGCVVQTAQGSVRAERVVIATQLPFGMRGMFFAKTAPQRSYAIAAKHDTPPEGMYLSADEPRSIRPHYGADATYLIVGGEGHKVGQDDNTESHYDALQDYARKHFDMSAQMQWSAQDYMPADDIPYIGYASRGNDRVFVATGFKKWGLSTGAFAGVLIRDLMNGADNPWADVFDARRIDPKHSVATLLKENANVAKRMVGDRIADIAPKGVEDLAPGEGAVVETVDGIVAAYRDDGGDVTLVSPVCTHLGCHVRFNDAERSWDCPCHGSRFTTDGAVISGPALEPLKEIEPAERS